MSKSRCMDIRKLVYGYPNIKLWISRNTYRLFLVFMSLARFLDDPLINLLILDIYNWVLYCNKWLWISNIILCYPKMKMDILKWTNGSSKIGTKKNGAQEVRNFWTTLTNDNWWPPDGWLIYVLLLLQTILHANSKVQKIPDPWNTEVNGK